MKKQGTRVSIVAAAAAVTIWLAVTVEPTDPASAGILAQPENTKQGASAPRSRFAELPIRAGMDKSGTDLFEPRSWAPTAPAKAQVTAAALPPLPFKFAGMVAQGGSEQLLLARDDRVFPVTQGEILDGGYRVESISDDEIVLLYLPLNARQSVPVSSAIGLKTNAPIVAAKATQSESIAPVATTSAVQLRWEGPQQVHAGSNFNVSLRITAGERVRNSPMQLRFNADVLEAVGVRPGKFFAGKRKFKYVANRAGSIDVSLSGTGNAIARDIELLMFTFRPIKADATAEIRISSLDLRGRSGHAVAFDTPVPFRASVSR